MTYRIEFQPSVLRQLNGFPGDALDGLVSAMADVMQYPDDPLRTVPVPFQPGERQAVFGRGGLVTYAIDEARRVVAVTDVTWAG